MDDFGQGVIDAIFQRRNAREDIENIKALKVLCRRCCIFTSETKTVPFAVIGIKRFVEVYRKLLLRSLDWKPSFGGGLSDFFNLSTKDVLLRLGKKAACVREHPLDYSSNLGFKSVAFSIRIDREKHATTKRFFIAVTTCKMFKSLTKIVALCQKIAGLENPLIYLPEQNGQDQCKSYCLGSRSI